ncbi:MAG: hypothetical protein R3A79_24150 [Nannocystaceae bacterium]
MSRLRLIVGLVSSLTVGLVVGCFREATPAPGFRFQCASNDDCVALVDEDGDPVVNENGEPYVEQCIAGLCQYACSGSILDLVSPSGGSDCPSDRDGYTCFNGTCNHLCDAADELPPCPSPQTCIEFTELLAVFGDAAEGFQESLESLPQEKPGICGILCDAADAPACPDGQVCYEGVCIGFDSGGGTTGTTGDATDGTTGPDFTTTSDTLGTTTL